MTTYELHRGSTPLLISMPHVGTEIIPEMEHRLTDEAQALPDTDWHVDRLYSFAREMGASMIHPRYSRYVIDLNRDPSGKPLYPGASNTELCPTTLFSGNPMYRPGMVPDQGSLDRRTTTCWKPYHDALAAELERLRATHGIAVLYDAHSIRSIVPRFFEGQLPDYNIGTGGSSTCHQSLEDLVTRICKDDTGRTTATNGRFKGGFITRHYGNPQDGVHSVQMELSQRNYMDEAAPFPYLEDRASTLTPVLRQVIEGILGWTSSQLCP